MAGDDEETEFMERLMGTNGDSNGKKPSGSTTVTDLPIIPDRTSPDPSAPSSGQPIDPSVEDLAKGSSTILPDSAYPKVGPIEVVEVPEYLKDLGVAAVEEQSAPTIRIPSRPQRELASVRDQLADRTTQLEDAKKGILEIAQSYQGELDKTYELERENRELRTAFVRQWGFEERVRLLKESIARGETPGISHTDERNIESLFGLVARLESSIETKDFIFKGYARRINGLEDQLGISGIVSYDQGLEMLTGDLGDIGYDGLLKGVLSEMYRNGREAYNMSLSLVLRQQEEYNFGVEDNFPPIKLKDFNGYRALEHSGVRVIFSGVEFPFKEIEDQDVEVKLLFRKDRDNGGDYLFNEESRLNLERDRGRLLEAFRYGFERAFREDLLRNPDVRKNLIEQPGLAFKVVEHYKG
ncbi:hypothetical protein ACFLZX_04560 [Nanoarchaeota archaeon]